MSRDNALWCAFIIAVFAAAWIAARFLPERPTDWDAPATDEPDDHACEIPPVAWSNATDRYVCAATVEFLPDGICGWPADNDPCPEHGNLTRGAL